MSAAFTFRTHPVDPRLQPWIRGSWEFVAAIGAPAMHHVPPDGTAFVVLVDQAPGGPVLFGYGPQIEPLVVSTPPGVRFRGLQLAPDAAPALFGLDAGSLLRAPIVVTRIGPVAAADVMAALRGGSLPDASHAIEAAYLPIMDQLPELDGLVAAALRQIDVTRGVIGLGALATGLGTTSRTLLRRVRVATGLTPKQHARVARFFAAAQGMLQQHKLSDLAAQGGYADQPHFHHEVAALTGLTPAQLAARVRSTDHHLDG